MVTHLLETGTEIRFIQELLGQYSIKNNHGYAKVAPGSLAQIKNPTDSKGN